MKFAVATVLLSTFVFAQAYQKSVVIENAEDLNENKETRSEFCGIVKQCDIVPDIAKSSAVLNLASRLDQLKQLNVQLHSDLATLSANAELSKKQNRFADYKSIADMKPVFWLSGNYFDGLKQNVDAARTGTAPLTDILGNAVTRIGNVPVTNVRGNSAYMFDKSNSISSSVSVSKTFTFAVVYKFPNVPVQPEGRFFTSNNGNKLFAGWNAYAQQLYIEGWINNNAVMTSDTVILIMTNDNGVKNLWTHDKQLVLNSNIGANDWGQVVIGRPKIYENEAAQVNVFEAMVFDKVLSAEQRYNMLSVLKRWYGFN